MRRLKSPHKYLVARFLLDSVNTGLLEVKWKNVIVLDLQDFFNAIGGQSDSEVSLLFQAVIFAGTAFVDLQFLLDAGFENRLAARAYFF